LRGELRLHPPANAAGLFGGESRRGGTSARLVIDVRTLTDGGQTSPEIARTITDFLGAAERTLDIALYDVRLHDPSAQIVRGAFDDARARGVAIRLAYNVDHPTKA